MLNRKNSRRRASCSSWPARPSTSAGEVPSIKVRGLIADDAQVTHKTYDQGDRLTLDAAGQRVEFVVAQVERRRVVLVRDGQSLVLNMPERRLVGTAVQPPSAS